MFQRLAVHLGWIDGVDRSHPPPDEDVRDARHDHLCAERERELCRPFECPLRRPGVVISDNDYVHDDSL